MAKLESNTSTNPAHFIRENLPTLATVALPLFIAGTYLLGIDIGSRLKKPQSRGERAASSIFRNPITADLINYAHGKDGSFQCVFNYKGVIYKYKAPAQGVKIDGATIPRLYVLDTTNGKFSIPSAHMNKHFVRIVGDATIPNSIRVK